MTPDDDIERLARVMAGVYHDKRIAVLKIEAPTRTNFIDVAWPTFIDEVKAILAEQTLMDLERLQANTPT